MAFTRFLFCLILFTVASVNTVVSAQFVNFGAPKKFIELEVHFDVGGSGVFQNYMKCFNQIKELNTTAGTSFGIGSKAVFGVSDFLGFGTELNFVLNRYSIDFAVTNAEVSSVSNIFLRNRYTYANIPVFVSFRFNASNSVRWNINLGVYYEYGLFGNQKQTIYNTSMNELGQLVPQTVEIKPAYFGSDETFINSFYHSDLGFHFSTGLTFGGHITIGAKLNLGFKNISYTDGLINPSIHNYSIMGSIGYQF